MAELPTDAAEKRRCLTIVISSADRRALSWPVTYVLEVRCLNGECQTIDPASVRFLLRKPPLTMPRSVPSNGRPPPCRARVPAPPDGSDSNVDEVRACGEAGPVLHRSWEKRARSSRPTGAALGPRGVRPVTPAAGQSDDPSTLGGRPVATSVRRSDPVRTRSTVSPTCSAGRDLRSSPVVGIRAQHLVSTKPWPTVSTLPATATCCC